jgi:hypothetical protein
MIGVTEKGAYDRTVMSDELERVSPREEAHVKARDRKVRGPKVVAVNPGLRKLAQHIAEKTKTTAAQAKMTRAKKSR